MTPRLADKVALIAGATSGIGRATALAFAREGARLALTGRREELGNQLVEQIRAEGGEAVFIRCDVRRHEDCERAVAEALSAFVRMDILYNNAGIVPTGTVLETPLDVWDDLLATNVSGTFYMCRAALPHMIARRSGVIINCASDWSMVGGQRAAAYCASKGAIALLTKAMALDHGRQGIRVNAIAPGDTQVERWKDHVPPDQTLDGYLADLGESFALGRVASAEEMARAILFLASEDSSYMTGQLLVVDGGNTAGGTAVRF